MSGHTNHGGKGGKIRVIYRCRTKLVERNCDTKSINILYLDGYVLRLITDIMKRNNRKKFMNLLSNIIEDNRLKIEKKISESEEKTKLYKEEIKVLTEKINGSQRALDKLLTEQMNDFMNELDQSHNLTLRLKQDLKQLTKVDEKYINLKFQKIRAKLNSNKTKREAVYQLVKEIIINNDFIRITFSFNTLLEQEVHEDLLFDVVEKRENIAFKNNHHKLKLVFS